MTLPTTTRIAPRVQVGVNKAWCVWLTQTAAGLEGLSRRLFRTWRRAVAWVRRWAYGGLWAFGHRVPGPVALSVSIFLTTPDPHRTRQNVWKRNCRSSFHDPCGAAKRHTTFVLSHDSTLLFPMHTCLWMKCAPAPQALLPTEPAHASQESMDFKRRFPALAKPALEQRHSLLRQN